MLAAVSRRYQRQADAMKDASKSGSSASPRTHGGTEAHTSMSDGVSTSISDLVRSKNPQLLSRFRVKVR